MRLAPNTLYINVARDIAHLPSVEQLVTVDDILERLIEGVTHVQRTIGIRRAIM